VLTQEWFEFRYLIIKKYIYYLVLLSLMESITIKVEERFAKEIEKAMKLNYSTKTEFIREAIRDKLKELRMQQIDERVLKSFGKSPVKTPLWKDRVIREQVSKEYLKKFNLE
jgi:hypothetical protein